MCGCLSIFAIETLRHFSTRVGITCLIGRAETAKPTRNVVLKSNTMIIVIKGWGHIYSFNFQHIREPLTKSNKKRVIASDENDERTQRASCSIRRAITLKRLLPSAAAMHKDWWTPAVCALYEYIYMWLKRCWIDKSLQFKSIPLCVHIGGELWSSTSSAKAASYTLQAASILLDVKLRTLVLTQSTKWTVQHVSAHAVGKGRATRRGWWRSLNHARRFALLWCISL